MKTKKGDECVIRYNLLVVFSPDLSHVLMCRRSRPPYQGLLNFLGGKILPGEESEKAAYRELSEESGIQRDDIRLIRLMDFVYHAESFSMEVYVGRLKEPIAVQGTENELIWLDAEQDFFDAEQFAGDGNLGHILACIRRQKERLFAPEEK